MRNFLPHVITRHVRVIHMDCLNKSGNDKRGTIICCALLLLALSACGVGQEMQQGGAALEEASKRGYMGTIECQRQRDLARMGFQWDRSKCPPVQ